MGNEADLSGSPGSWTKWANNNTNEKQAKLSPTESRVELRLLKMEFDRKAADYRRMSTAIGSALEALEEADKFKKDVALREKEGAEKKAQEQAAMKIKAIYDAAGDKKSQEQFYFLPDGSGSMADRKLSETLKAIGILQSAGAAASSGWAHAIIWGDSSVKPTGDLDLTNPEIVEKYDRGLGCGTELSVLIEKMNEIAASAKSPTHFVVVTDGDAYDVDQAKASFGQLLGKNSNVSLDFVFLKESNNGWGTSLFDRPLRDVAESLQKVFPTQVGSTSVDLSAGNVLDAFTGIIQRQFQSAVPAPPSPKKPSGPSMIIRQ